MQVEVGVFGGIYDKVDKCERCTLSEPQVTPGPQRLGKLQDRMPHMVHTFDKCR